MIFVFLFCVALSCCYFYLFFIIIFFLLLLFFLLHFKLIYSQCIKRKRFYQKNRSGKKCDVFFVRLIHWHQKLNPCTVNTSIIQQCVCVFSSCVQLQRHIESMDGCQISIISKCLIKLLYTYIHHFIFVIVFMSIIERMPEANIVEFCLNCAHGKSVPARERMQQKESKL